MEDEEVISRKENDNDSESQDIAMEKGVSGINCDADEEKKMEKGEYPI